MMPLPVVAADTAGVRGGNAQLVKLSGDPLVTVSGRPPFEHHDPRAELVDVVRQKTHVVPGPPNLLPVF